VTWEYEKIAPVKWLVRRHTLLSFLYELASPEFQQERWIGTTHAPHWSTVVSAARKAYRLLRPRLLSEGDDILPPELPGSE
jgi:hypothetical protein